MNYEGIAENKIDKSRPISHVKNITKSSKIFSISQPTLLKKNIYDESFVQWKWRFSKLTPETHAKASRYANIQVQQHA